MKTLSNWMRRQCWAVIVRNNELLHACLLAVAGLGLVSCNATMHVYRSSYTWESIQHCTDLEVSPDGSVIMNARAVYGKDAAFTRSGLNKIKMGKVRLYGSPDHVKNIAREAVVLKRQMAKAWRHVSGAGASISWNGVGGIWPSIKCSDNRISESELRMAQAFIILYGRRDPTSPDAIAIDDQEEDREIIYVMSIDVDAASKPSSQVRVSTLTSGPYWALAGVEDDGSEASRERSTLMLMPRKFGASLRPDGGKSGSGQDRIGDAMPLSQLPIDIDTSKYVIDFKYLYLMETRRRYSYGMVLLYPLAACIDILISPMTAWDLTSYSLPEMPPREVSLSGKRL